MEIELNEAQAKLFELGELAREGQEIVITREGKPYLLLVTHTEHCETESATGSDGEAIGEL